MGSLRCEICGGSSLIKKGNYFVCSACGTSYSLEDARKLLNNLNSVHQNQSRIAAGMVCPKCGSDLEIIDDEYFCTSIFCNYRYNIDTYNTTNRANTTTQKKELYFECDAKVAEIRPKHKLIITSSGLNWNGKLYKKETITGYTYANIQHGMSFYFRNRLPYNKMGSINLYKTYDTWIWVNGDFKEKLLIPGDKYDEYIKAMWEMCGRNIFIKMLHNLNNGTNVRMDILNNTIKNDGLIIVKTKIFGKDIPYFFNWDYIRNTMLVEHKDGTTWYAFPTVDDFNGPLTFHLNGSGLLPNENYFLLSAIIDIMRKSPKAKLVTDVLSESSF